MNSLRVLIIALISAALLSACKTEVKTDVYSSDLFSTENLKTPATMRIEISSCNSEDRDEFEKSVLALFDNDSNAKITGCVRDGLDSLIEASFQAEIASQSSNADLILFRMNEDEEKYQVRGMSAIFSNNFIQRVESLMEENMTSLDYDDLTFSVVLNNDESSTVLVTSYFVWVDGEAHETYVREELNRREKITIKLPDVASDLILKGEQPQFLWVSKPIE